jgi:hypothetical protein
VVYGLGGLVFPHIGLIPPAPGGDAFTVLSDGDYEYDFYIVGQHDQADLTSLEFVLVLNGVPQGAPHEFRSNQQNGATDVQVVRGQGIISIGAGAAVSVRNRTGSAVGGIAVTVAGTAPGGELGANRTLSLKKLSA